MTPKAKVTIQNTNKLRFHHNEKPLCCKAHHQVKKKKTKTHKMEKISVNLISDRRSVYRIYRELLQVSD